MTEIRLQDIDIFNQPHCKIKNRDHVEMIINELLKGGARKLQVISDFDCTITKQRLDNNEPVLSSFCIFENCKSLPKHYLEASKELLKQYQPLEKDPTLPIEEKIKYMIEWWDKSNNLLKGFAFDRSEIDEVAYNYRNGLRDGTHDLFHALNRLNVPLLVFSAGLGDSVQSLLKQANLLLPNIKIVSNFLKYKDGLLDGFQNNIIHIFNKNELALRGTEYYDLVHDRDHVIVMGDSIGDADMAKGVARTSYVLKIGFLFDHIEQNLENYMNAFDIVLLDDQTMDLPNKIISLIESKNKDNNNID